MRPAASVRSIRALDNWKGSLGRFSGEAQEVLQRAEQEIERVLSWLQERLNYWRGEVQRRREEVLRAQAALARCQASGRYDRHGHYHAPNCGAQVRALHLAEERLREAEAELHNVQQWMRRVEEAVKEYRIHSRRLKALATTHTEKAQAFLGQKISDLERYVALTSAVSVLGPTPLNAVRLQYKRAEASARGRAKREAKRQEIELVQKTRRGTRDWSDSQLRQLKNARSWKDFPKGYVGHHINNVARFPDLAGNPDNIRFVTPKREHFVKLHRKSCRNNTSGKMFNRKSLMVQRAKHRPSL